MGKTTYDEERLRKGLERETIRVDDSLVRIDGEIFHKELYQALPWKVIFGGLSEYERQLLYLSMVDRMSVKEIARDLDKDISKVRYDLYKATAKIRNQARKLLQKDDAANKLLLTWEQIRAKGNRIPS